MKSLIDIIKEEGVATPLNTMGVGNPVPPTEGEPGSEPICTNCKKKKKVKVSCIKSNGITLS